MKLRDYVTEIRFQHLLRRLQTARRIQLLSLLLTGLAFFSSPLLFGQPPSNSGNALLGWVSFTTYLALAVVSLLLDNANPTAIRVHSGVILCLAGFGAGVVSLIVMYWGPIHPILIIGFLSGPILMLIASLFRAIPSTDISISKRRGAPPGQFGNLGGMRAEVGVTRRQRFIGMAVLGSGLSLLILIPEGGFTGGPWHELGESIRRGNPNWALVALFTLVPAVVGTCVGIVAFLTKKGLWEPLVLDTFAGDRLWFYHGDSLAFWEMKDPIVERLDERAIKISHRWPRRISIKMRTTTEGETSRLLQTLEHGQSSSKNRIS